MFYWLLYPLQDHIPLFRLFSYVSIRALGAIITAFLIFIILKPYFIQLLTFWKAKETIYINGPKRHLEKTGTPTMGGILIIFACSISLLLWGNLSNAYVLLIWSCTILLSMVGFLDDYQKSIRKVHNGISARKKLILQILIGAIFTYTVYSFPYYPIDNPNLPYMLYIPFIKNPVLLLGLLNIPFWIFIIAGSSNAVNITDGLDGLAIGLSVIVLSVLFILTYITGIYDISTYLITPFIPEVNELCVFLAALIGSSVGFLWYNTYPAEIFMGDTGSLAIGGAIGMIAITIRQEFLLIILCGVFIIEILSVIIQVLSYKLYRKRVFLMAPLHHHFELKGLHESKIVIRFWIVGLVLALLALSSLKIR